jgi:hypothetical protein
VVRAGGGGCGGYNNSKLRLCHSRRGNVAVYIRTSARAWSFLPLGPVMALCDLVYSARPIVKCPSRMHVRVCVCCSTTVLVLGALYVDVIVPSSVCVFLVAICMYVCMRIYIPVCHSCFL